VNVNSVGPSWGSDVTAKAQRALIFFFLAIALYITWRFEWKMALAALSAVVHDIAVTVGVYSLSGFEVTPATVIAFLTILGYSLYDTIVVFDKVDENTRGLAASGRITYADTVNLSMNQTLMRSLNTSLVAILPIMSVLVIGAFMLGATTLQDFGLALMVGLLTGAYSSIYIASPILAILKEREPRYASIRQRVLARGGAGAPLTPAAAAVAGGATVSTGDGEGVLRPGAARTGGSPARPHGTGAQGKRPPPRPRKKGKRR
ncbi:MAG: protein translocase subunit SecF, partial [Actinomycetota bacterium]|nr:protein translocase subunit SecF [Actinomycetota bacterium]